MRVNADSLLIRAAATSTSGTLNDLTTDLIMANNNNNNGSDASSLGPIIYDHNLHNDCDQVNLILNLDKTTCTLFTPDPAEYISNLDLKYTTMHYPW